jgi:hypothetical protein
VPGRLVERVEGVVVGDERAVDLDVVAGGAAEPGHVPGVEDADLVSGQQGESRGWRAVSLLLEQERRDHPVGV